MVIFPFQKRVASKNCPVIKIWNDLNFYKKIFITQGFYHLSSIEEVKIELVPFEYFFQKGAPAQISHPYFNYKNILIFEVLIQDKSVKIAYDTNDLYYKIPNDILGWSDLYFKSNYQYQYLKTGKLLSGDYWDNLRFRPECLPEPIDTSQSHKILPCSFCMELFPNVRKNRRFIQKWTGGWLKSPMKKKGDSLFFLGRWWGDTRIMTQHLFEQISKLNLKVNGGIVKADSIIPNGYERYEHKAVSIEKWVAMCCQSKISAMTRGLDGCMSFKALNYLMLGSPFIGAEAKTNFWQPILPGVNYICVKDDFSDLEQVLGKCEDSFLLEMGQKNLEHWQKYISPEATARYILKEAQRIL